MPVQSVFSLRRPPDSRASASPAPNTDPLLAFASEDETGARVGPQPASEVAPEPKPRRGLWYAFTAAAAVAAVVALALTTGTSVASPLEWWQPGSPVPQPATLTITTRPEGAQVSIDGEARGVTPLTLAISPGPHTLTVRAGDQERVMPLTAAAGSDIVRDLEMTVAAPAAALGGLTVATDPPGARVAIDGRPAGTSPVSVEGLAAGTHTVAVTGATGSAERIVTIPAGQTSSVVFALPQAAGPVAGWLAVSVPFDVQVMERDEIIGASGGARIMLASGRHDIVLVNRALEYQESRRIDVRPGQTTTLTVEAPTVTMNVNARPWAEVSIDGRELGQTPISNATVTVGTHQFVFRHPQLGERRQTVVITNRGTQRIAVDLTR